MRVPNPRVIAAALTVSTSGLSFLANHEGFTTKAVIPIPGDRPTYGYGSTFKADGTPVKMGDRISEPEARKLLHSTLKNQYEAGIHKCAGDIPMHQYEFDALVDAAYNLGVSTVCKSGMVRHFRAGEYEKGCQFFLKYKYAAGKDCSLPESKCMGVWKRRLAQVELCKGEAK